MTPATFLQKLWNATGRTGVTDPALLAALRRAFDAGFYRRMYPDVQGSDAALLRHYLRHGWKEGRDPAPDFSTLAYADANLDVIHKGHNPFVHYVGFGRHEGRPSFPAGTRVSDVHLLRDAGTALSSASLRRDRELVRHFFNPGYYRASNPEVTGSDDDLIDHYLTIGWKKGRNPSPLFSLRFYLDTYPDVAAAAINPLIHFALNGRAEGRRTKGSEDGSIERVDGLLTIAPHLQALMLRPGPGPVAVPPAQSNPACLTIHWIVPDFSPGSGGHMTIFRMIRALEDAGHRCKVWIEFASMKQTAAVSYDEIVKYYQCLSAEVAFLKDGFFEATGDAVVATGWTTAHVAARATGFAAKYYFVQDHEPEFYPTGADRVLAEASYGFDLACICASPWLEQLMARRYGRWARHFHLAYDHEVYQPPAAEVLAERFDPARTTPVRIAVYARDHTARRCVQLALMALDKLGAEGVAMEVHFFGQKDLPFKFAGYRAFSHGILSALELAALYARCDIGICFSGTNYSLVPQEMMATGLPVVELNTDSTRAIFPDGVVTFAGPDPDHIADRLKALIGDPGLRRAQMEVADAWVRQFTWEGAAVKVEAAIRDYLGEKGKLSAPVVQASRGVLLDVVIPTYNGLHEVKPVIEALRRQRLGSEMQIFCVDSSSSDGTADWLRDQRDVALTVIPKADFQHGRTRNLGASLGRAPHIAMLTQDAVPVNSAWAGDIVRMFDHYPRAAGLMGRHLPYPQHPKFVRDEIIAVFQNLLRHPLLLTKDTRPDLWEKQDQGWRQLLHFYSDNNSAMRRAVWNEIPYPEIDYGEDQVWAWQIINAGHGKLYAPSVMVYHSHDYDPGQTFERSKTEGAFFYTQFGYRLGDGSDKDLEKKILHEQEAFRRRAGDSAMNPDEIALRVENIAAKQRGWRAGLLGASGARR